MKRLKVKTFKIHLDLTESEIYCLQAGLSMIFKEMEKAQASALLEHNHTVIEAANDTFESVKEIMKQMTKRQKRWYHLFPRRNL